MREYYSIDEIAEAANRAREYIIVKAREKNEDSEELAEIFYNLAKILIQVLKERS